MAVHAFGVGANLARSALQWPKVDVQRKRQPLVTGSERQWGTPVSSSRQQSRQQVPRRGHEVCIFQGGVSSGSHCQLGRR